MRHHFLGFDSARLIESFGREGPTVKRTAHLHEFRAFLRFWQACCREGAVRHSLCRHHKIHKKHKIAKIL